MSLLFSCFIIILALLFLRGALSLAPWVPTRREAIVRLWDIIDIKAWEYFLEIGSWDGRVVSFLAKKYPDSYFVGIEIVPYLYFVWLVRKYIWGLSNLELKLWNALKENIDWYQHIFVFWLPESIKEKLLPRFEKEANRSTKLYSYAFSFPKEYQNKVQSFWGDNLQKIHIYTQS